MCQINGGPSFAQLAKLRIFGKSPINAYLRFNRRLWTSLPASVTALGPMRSYGDFLHALVRVQSVRGQLPHTFFLRNRPALELLRRIVEKRPNADTLRIAVLGCSAGAEAYSVAWRIRSARPDLKLILQAVDISETAIELAKSGVYSPAVSELMGTDMFESMTESETKDLFDVSGEVFTVKPWLKECIEWHLADVSKPEILDIVGLQDIVVANNFLCHMNICAAQDCLRNIARLVCSDGYMFVSGIDLDIRTRVAEDLGWQPLTELLEEIHYGDPRTTAGWPWNYSALEPLNKKRSDWKLRYAATFRLVPSGNQAGNVARNGCSGLTGASATRQISP
jgi:hypothetical protein